MGVRRDDVFDARVEVGAESLYELVRGKRGGVFVSQGRQRDDLCVEADGHAQTNRRVLRRTEPLHSRIGGRNRRFEVLAFDETEVFFHVCACDGEWCARLRQRDQRVADRDSVGSPPKASKKPSLIELHLLDEESDQPTVIVCERRNRLGICLRGTGFVPKSLQRFGAFLPRPRHPATVVAGTDDSRWISASNATRASK